MQSIIVLVPFFGERIPWIDPFLMSCAFNQTIAFAIVTNIDLPYQPNNVIHVKISFNQYVGMIKQKLRIEPKWTQPYKLSDLKPVLGFMFSDLIKGYDFWGYSDIDLIYGDIRAIYDDYVLSHDIISTHTYLMCGHFALYRNFRETTELFTCFGYWRELFEAAEYSHFDEVHLTEFLLFEMKQIGFDRFRAMYAPQIKFDKKISDRELKILFREQFTTFNAPWLLPNGVFGITEKWTWDRGKIYSDLMPGREILYAHFSKWNSGLWGAKQDDHKPWKYKDAPVSSLLNSKTQRFSITKDGFAPDCKIGYSFGFEKSNANPKNNRWI